MSQWIVYILRKKGTLLCNILSMMSQPQSLFVANFNTGPISSLHTYSISSDTCCPVWNILFNTTS
jgi:hypothetical protein